MSDNRDIVRTSVQKADLALSDFTNNGGVLAPQQAQDFFRIMITPSVLLGDVFFKTMRGPTDRVDQVGFLSRILRRGSDGVALSLGDRSKPSLAKVDLTAQEIKTEVSLTYGELEDSIEEGRFQQTVMDLMAQRARTDLEELVVNGDTSSTDNFLNLFNGLLKQISSNVLDRNGGSAQTIQLGHFTDSCKTMPAAFFNPDASQMRFYTGKDPVLKFREVLASRATPGGDAWLSQDGQITVYGIPLKSVPLFPQNLGSGTNESNMVLIDPKNIQVGIWRELNWKTLDDPRGGNVYIIGRMRGDMKLRYEPASVKSIHMTF